MERLLVTGIDTLVGSNLALALSDRCQVLGFSGRPLQLGPCEVRTASDPTIDDPHEIESCVHDWEPQWIVHCGPLATSSWDQPAETLGQREPLLVAHLADLSQRCGCRLTVISSDVVFHGPRMFHEESSPTTSTAARAAQVRNMERAVPNDDVLVVRTCAYGWSLDEEGTGFAELAFDALTRRAPLAPLFSNGRRHATPILATDLAELLWRAYESHLHGLFHLAGTERTSPHRFASELAAAVGVPLTASSPDHAEQIAGGAAETSLSSKPARRALAAATPILRDGIDRFVAQADNGWRSRLRQTTGSHNLQPLAA